MDDRSARIVIGGKEYELLLTTRATKEIAKKYGGLSKLGDSMLKSEDYDEAIGEIVWLITLLANQPIMIHNLRCKDDIQPLLTEEEVELLTVPSDLASYRDAISEAMVRGTKREIVSEESKKAVNG